MNELKIQQFHVLEGQSMPHRIALAVLAWIMPSEPPSALGLTLGLAGSAMLSGFYATPGSFQIFAYAAAADYLTGLYACSKNGGEFNWSVGAGGIVRKFVLGVTIGLMWRICGVIGGLETFASLITYAFAINEGASTITNLKNAKYQIPGVVEAALENARALLESRLASGIRKTSDQQEKKGLDASEAHRDVGTARWLGDKPPDDLPPDLKVQNKEKGTV